MSKYSAYEGQHYKCRCCEADEITCKPVTIVSTTGKYIGEGEAGKTFKVPDSTITNSNNTYEYKLPATVDLELPDIPHIDTNGNIVYAPAQTPFECSVLYAPNNVINTEGTLLGETDPPNDFVAPDSTIDINSGFFFNTPSGDTENIDIIDNAGNLIPIINQTADTVEVEVIAGCPAGVVTIVDSLGNIIGTQPVASGGVGTFVVTVKNTNGDVVPTTIVNGELIVDCGTQGVLLDTNGNNLTDTNNNNLIEA